MHAIMQPPGTTTSDASTTGRTAGSPVLFSTDSATTPLGVSMFTHESNLNEQHFYCTCTSILERVVVVKY